MRGEDTNRGRKCSGGIRTGYYRSILCSLVKEGPYRVNQPWKQITCGAVISLLPQVLLQSYHHLFTWHRSPNSLLTSVRSVPHLFSSSRPGPSGSRSLRARARPPAGKGGEREENRDAADNLTVNHVLVHFPFHSFRSLCRSITAPRVKREVNEVKDESNEWIGSGNE